MSLGCFSSCSATEGWSSPNQKEEPRGELTHESRPGDDLIITEEHENMEKGEEAFWSQRILCSRVNGCDLFDPKVRCTRAARCDSTTLEALSTSIRQVVFLFATCSIRSEERVLMYGMLKRQIRIHYPHAGLSAAKEKQDNDVGDFCPKPCPQLWLWK